MINNIFLAVCTDAETIMFNAALRGTQCPLVPPTSDSDTLSLRRCIL